MDANTLPTELRTDRLILRAADVSTDADCAKVNYVRNNAVGGPTHKTRPEPEAMRQVRYKNRVHGARQELCTLVPAPANINWLLWLPASDRRAPESDDLSNLVGLVALSFRQELPYPDLGYMTVAAHGGHGYAAEGGREVLRYWRDFVGVREIFIGCPLDNRASQRCAEKIGLVRGGTLAIETGQPPDVVLKPAVAYVLPGMQWKEGWVARPQAGWQEKIEK